MRDAEHRAVTNRAFWQGFYASCGVAFAATVGLLAYSAVSALLAWLAKRFFMLAIG